MILQSPIFASSKFDAFTNCGYFIAAGENISGGAEIAFNAFQDSII